MKANTEDRKNAARSLRERTEREWLEDFVECWLISQSEISGEVRRASQERDLASDQSLIEHVDRECDR